MILSLLVALIAGASADPGEGGFQEAYIRFPARVGDCPAYEEFRRRAYARLQAEVVHPLRMLARTQAEEEKARCEQLRTGLVKALEQDWTGWAGRDGLVEAGKDSADLFLALGRGEYREVHALTLEVAGLDVVRNGNRFEHHADFRVVARSDTQRVVERRASATGFGDLARAGRELADQPRKLALSILEDPRFLKSVQVVAVDSSAWGGAFRFVKGPGTLLPGRRLVLEDSMGGRGGWAVAWGPEGSSRQWVARPVDGGQPSVGRFLREVPGDVTWRANLACLRAGSAWGAEVSGGPRFPVGPSVRVGLETALRTHDFSRVAPDPVPLRWGVGLGVAPEIVFQRNFRRWVLEAGGRAGLRLDLASVEGACQGWTEGGGWARRGELVATLQVTALWASDPANAWGASVSWDAFQGRGAWEVPDRTLEDARGAGRFRAGIAYRFWP